LAGKCTTNIHDDGGVDRYSFSLSCDTDVSSVTLKQGTNEGYIMDDLRFNKVKEGSEVVPGQIYYYIVHNVPTAGKRALPAELLLSVRDAAGEKDHVVTAFE
jgi:hypothetical protein